MRGILYVLRAAIVQPMFSTKREYWKKDSISMYLEIGLLALHAKVHEASKDQTFVSHN